MTQPEKKRSPVFSSRPVTTEISVEISTEISTPNVKPQSRGVAPSSPLTEASPEISRGEEEMLQRAIAGKTYLIETVAPLDLSPAQLEEIEAQKQMVTATAAEYKLRAQLNGATPEQQEIAYQQGIQAGVQLWGSQQFDRQLQLYEELGTHRRSDQIRRARIMESGVFRDLSESIPHRAAHGNDESIVFLDD